MWRWVLCIGVYLVCLPVLTLCKVDSGLLLTYKDDQEVVNLYSEGSSGVFASFSLEGHLLECDMGPMVGINIIFEEAIRRGPYDAKVMMFDLRRLARQCKRHVRKMLRLKEAHASPEALKSKKRIGLHVGYPGTEWCATVGQMSNKTVSKEGREADTCCKTLHSCHDVIKGMGYHLNTFNPYPWPVYSCACAENFRKCLRSAKTPVATEIGRLYFNEVRVRCYTEKESDRCVSWDRWFTKCTETQVEKNAELKHTDTFTEQE